MGEGKEGIGSQRRELCRQESAGEMRSGAEGTRETAKDGAPKKTLTQSLFTEVTRALILR